MVATVRIVGMKALRRAFAAYAREFEPTSSQGRVLLNRLGRGGRTLVRRQITTQGGGSWEPLSKWTQARTGRRKALITERERVTFRRKPRSVEIVYAERENGWNLTSHHKGFTTGGFKNKKVTIKLVQPSKLGLSRGGVTIRQAKPSKVPARNVWTDERTIYNQVVEPITNKWALSILNKKGR